MKIFGICKGVTRKYMTVLTITIVFYHLLPQRRLIKHTDFHCSAVAAQVDRIILTLVITKACVGWMFYYLIFCHPLLRFVVAVTHGLNDIPQGYVSTKANIVQGNRRYCTREGRVVLHLRPRHLPQTLHSLPYSTRIVLFYHKTLHVSVLLFPHLWNGNRTLICVLKIIKWILQSTSRFLIGRHTREENYISCPNSVLTWQIVISLQKTFGCIWLQCTMITDQQNYYFRNKTV